MQDIQIKAKIFKSAKRLFDCQLSSDKRIVQAVAHASVLRSSPPVVGDDVLLKYDNQNDQYEVLEVLPRQSIVFRSIVRERKKKVIAANVDCLVIVTSVSKPTYKAGLVDRYLLRSNQWEIPAVVVFNKMDEFNEQFDIEHERKKLEQLYVKNFKVVAKNPEFGNFELEQLKNYLKGRVAMFVGQSGVGKSKLITALSGGLVELKSNQLAKGVGKGAHTTTWAEMIDCHDFYLVDSPGIRSMSIEDLSYEELVDCFEDLHEGITQCQFRDCNHNHNSKGCYFNQLDASQFENQVILERLDSFKRFKEEISGSHKR